MEEDDVEDDAIELYPVVSWEVAGLSDEGGMNASECEDLGMALLRAAKEAREGPSDETE